MYGVPDLYKRARKAGIKPIIDCETPVLVLSQISRPHDSKRDRRPNISRLNWPGNIEPHADKAFVLYREAYDHGGSTENAEDKVLIEVILAKNANGSLGIVKLAFMKCCCRFEEIQRSVQIS